MLEHLAVLPDQAQDCWVSEQKHVSLLLPALVCYLSYLLGGWVDGWMDGWMDNQMNAWMNGEWMNDDCQISCLMPCRNNYSFYKQEIFVFKSVLMESFQTFLGQWLLSLCKPQQDIGPGLTPWSCIPGACRKKTMDFGIQHICSAWGRRCWSTELHSSICR